MSPWAKSHDYVIPGRQPVREALLARRPLRAVVVEQGAGPELEEVAQQAREAGVAVRRAGRREMDDLAGQVRHQGILAVAPPFPYVQLKALLSTDLVVVLDGVTDARNLGAIARVAEQAGAGGLVVRTRRAATPGPAAEKAAAGALSWLPVAAVTNVNRALEELRGAGLWLLGLEAGSERDLWDEPLLDERVALVVGEEGEGLSRLAGETVDGVLSIPSLGHLDSLNAATATAIAVFEWRRRHRPQ